MPGFTLIYQYEGLDDGITRRIEKLEEASFRIQFISKTKNLVLLFREGNHYPYNLIETRKYIVIVEGRIYGIDPASNKEFLSNCKSVFEDGLSNDLQDYFHQLDGEFIIYILSRKGDHIVMINDYLGRLPQYYSQAKQLIISRDLYVMDKITTGLLFDEATIYQFMRLGFPLGGRTLFHDINRVPYSASFEVNKDEIAIHHKPIDLEEMEASYTGNDPAGELYDYFRLAIKNRLLTDERKVVSLSGGLDSRVIIGEIEKSHKHVDYVTFLYDNSIIKQDVEIAKEIGRAFGRSLQLVELKEWTPESFDELTYAKGGMNYLGMAFLVRFLSNMGHSFDTMITGDGGDKTLPSMHPLIKLRPKDFAKYVLKQNAISPKKTLDSFLTTDIKFQEETIVEYLNNLPGKTAKSKYKYFLFFERARHWLFEGEDRNRNYLWSTTPFYQPQFFNLAHSISEKEKYNYDLFRKFMDLVQQDLGNINNANWGFPLNDRKKIEKMYRRQRLKMRLPFFGGPSNSQSSFHSEMAILVAALMHKGYGGQIAVYADRHDLNAASSETLFHLITLLKVSEMSWRSL